MRLISIALSGWLLTGAASVPAFGFSLTGNWLHDACQEGTKASDPSFCIGIVGMVRGHTYYLHDDLSYCVPDGSKGGASERTCRPSDDFGVPL